MRKINDGGAAFPVDQVNVDGKTIVEPGMSLRDYFAAKAMEGLLSNPAIFEFSNFVVKHTDTRRDAWIAKQALEFADALLNARAQGE